MIAFIVRAKDLKPGQFLKHRSSIKIPEILEVGSVTVSKKGKVEVTTAGASFSGWKFNFMAEQKLTVYQKDSQ